MIRTAIVHDWLTGMRGGEQVLEAILELFPQAELFSLLHFPQHLSPSLSVIPCHTSWLQHLPQADRYYRYFLPWMPHAIERFDLSRFDLIISSSHCVAKGIRKPPHAVHISYIHAPMRYIWSRYEDYFSPGRSSPWVRWAARGLRPALQRWDQKTSTPDRIDLLLANSQFIADEIQTIYQRSAEVVHPFVDLTRFSTFPRNPKNYYLIVSAFAPYKRIDLAIEAFNHLQLPLWIVGSGQDAEWLHQKAGPTIRFLPSCSQTEVAQLYAECKAFIFPGIEDFGISPLEAMASGAPVIAMKKGGATETVTSETGLFFSPQTAESLIQCIQNFEGQPLQSFELPCRQRAAQFSKHHFQKNIFNKIRAGWKSAGKDPSLLDHE